MNLLGLSVVLMCLFTNILCQENPGMRAILRVYEECSKTDLTPCLKKKAVTIMDRLARMEKLPVLEGLTVVRNGDAPTTPVLTEKQLENSLPRSLEARDAVLDKMLMKKAINYISSRKIQITLPHFDTKEVSRSINEGRGKMKKMFGMVMMSAFANMAGYIPLFFAGLFLLAGKAVMISKVALLLAGILALKKILDSKNHGHNTVLQSSVGWNQRSYDDAQNLAYNAYAPQ